MCEATVRDDEVTMITNERPMSRCSRFFGVRHLSHNRCETLLPVEVPIAHCRPNGPRALRCSKGSGLLQHTPDGQLAEMTDIARDLSMPLSTDGVVVRHHELVACGLVLEDNNQEPPPNLVNRGRGGRVKNRDGLTVHALKQG